MDIFNDNKGKHALMSAVMAIGLIIVAILFNAVIFFLSEKFTMKIDLTENKIYELSDNSNSVLQSVNKEVKIIVLEKEKSFSNVNSYYYQANEILQKIRKNNAKIKIRYVDFFSTPEIVKEYSGDDLSEGAIIIECQDRYKIISQKALFNVQKDLTSDVEYIVSSKAEEVLVAAIMEVTREKQEKISVLKGYGCADISEFEDLLRKNGYIVDEMNLLYENINEDSDMIIIVKPVMDLEADVIEKLDGFLYNHGNYGKSVIYLADYTQTVLPNIEEYLEEWGINVGSGYLVETDPRRTYVIGKEYTIQKYNDSSFAEMMDNTDIPIVLYASRPLYSVFGASGANGSRSTSVLLSTYETAQVVKEESEPSDKGDEREKIAAQYATVMIGSKVKGADPDATSSHVAVIGSSSFVDEAFLSSSSVNNGEYGMGIVDRLCGKENSLTILPKKVGVKNLQITEYQSKIIGVIFQLIVPATVVLAGCVVWLSRRNK